MEHSYIYGTVRRNGELLENLKTKGSTHTDLSGYINSVQEYADSVVTDRCLIVEKYRSAEDSEGNCYDWYVIDKHYRYVDETKPLKAENKLLKEQVSAQADQAEFYEDCIAEMATVVYA